MSQPLVSVIIPTYNQRPFVAETIESVLCQTYSNFELIISDDGSTDGTADVLRTYAAREPDRIRVVLSDRNTGIAANFNRALAKHRGDLIAWLGGDDLMLPRKLELQVRALEARREAVGCVHDAEVFESPSGRVLGRFSERYNGRRAVREGGVELWFDPTYLMLPSTMMIRADAAPAHGFDERLRFANDWLFDIEVFRRGRCIALPDVLTRYRRHDHNVTAISPADRRELEENLMVLAIAQARYPELARLVRRHRTALLLVQAWRHAADCEMRPFARYGLAALREGGLVGSTIASARMVRWTVQRAALRPA